MNYELCKRLKEAGFPQIVIPWIQLHYDLAGSCPTHCIGNKDTCGCAICVGRDFIIIPTLSELIEAVPKEHNQDIFVLRFKHGKWQSGYSDGMALYPKAYEGKTPEESVANLFLTLNN